MKHLFFNVIFNILVNLPYMHCSLYFLEFTVRFLGHLSKLNDMFPLFSHFFDVFPLLSKVILFQFVHVFISIVENFETMGHWDPLNSLYELLSISGYSLFICNLSKVDVNIVDTNGAQLGLNIKKLREIKEFTSFSSLKFISESVLALA
jgi:hypothetical protein